MEYFLIKGKLEKLTVVNLVSAINEYQNHRQPINEQVTSEITHRCKWYPNASHKVYSVMQIPWYSTKLCIREFPQPPDY